MAKIHESPEERPQPDTWSDWVAEEVERDLALLAAFREWSRTPHDVDWDPEGAEPLPPGFRWVGQ